MTNVKKFRDYIFELLVIFVGISLSFYVDEWREKTENIELLKKNLAGIKLELVEDTVVLSKKLKLVDSANNLLSACLLDRKFEPKGDDVFEVWYETMATLNMIISNSDELQNNNASFKNYTQNSFSQYLNNLELRRHLNEYYEVKRIGLLEDEKILNEISEKLRSFVLSNVSLYKHTVTIAKGKVIPEEDLRDLSQDLSILLKNEEFLNYLSLKIERMNIHKYGSRNKEGDDMTYFDHISLIEKIIVEINKEVDH